MTTHSEPDDISRFIKAIEQLAPDNVVPKGTPGYNNYTTQRAHWLGWLGLDSESWLLSAQHGAPDVAPDMSTITSMSRRCCCGSLRLLA